MWRSVTVFLLVMVILSGCQRKFEDEADVKGRPENTCLESARVAQQSKYHGDNAADPKSFSTWIYKTELKFQTSALWSVKNDYPPKVTETGQRIERPGIKASSRILITELSARFPGLFTTEPVNSTFLVVKINCYPSKTFTSQSQSNEERELREYISGSQLPYVYKVNAKLGLKEFQLGSDTKSFPLDTTIVNPDGSAMLLRCSTTLIKQCSSTFLLASGVFVDYAYPIEQRADWESIHHFVIEQLKAAINE